MVIIGFTIIIIPYVFLLLLFFSIQQPLRQVVKCLHDAEEEPDAVCIPY